MTCRSAPMLLPLLAIALALPAAAGAQQTGQPSVDPALRLLLSSQTRQAAAPSGRFDLIPIDQPLPMAGLLSVSRDQRGRPTVGVFMEVSDRAALDAMRARAEVGTVVQAASGHYLLTARVPLDQADSLVQTRGLVSIFAARRVKSSNDSAVHSIGADQVRQLNGTTWVGSAGQGVIVGIYDTGLDFRHGDFLDASGKTRVLAAWDQTVTGGNQPGFGYTYGNLCTQAQINTAIAGTGGCSMTDIEGHGTHVTGSAAGNGGGAGTGTAYQYAGVAPAADLLVVKGGNGTFGFDQIIDGLIWMKRFAKAAGKPLVVNLSLGGQDGPHDGSTIPEQMIDDSMSAPGVIVSVAAGNEGSNGNSVTAQPPFLMHAGRVIATGETQNYTINIPTYTPNTGRCNDVEDVQLWYNGADNLDITVTRPDGTAATGSRGPQISGADGPGGEIYIDNGSSGLQPNGEYVAEVQFNDCGSSGATPASGNWTIGITGHTVTSGKMYHMWIAGADLGGKSGTGTTGFDNRYVVGTPGSARSVVTVGAYTSRTNWHSGASNWHFLDATPLGDIADFSSAGPTADGRAKPDIAAPGAAVVSSLSRDARASIVAGGNAALIVDDGQHWVLEGTSMATPMATGSVALLLQANPSLSADQVKAILKLSATQDGFTSRTYGGGAPQDFWGAGKLNVEAALAAMNTNPNAVAGVALNLHADSIPRNATEKLTAIVYNGIGVRLDSLVAWSSSNSAVATVDATGLLRAVGLGSAVVRAVVGAHQDSALIQVVPPSVLAISGSSIAASKPTTSVRGTRMPLLALSLKVTGTEGMKVTALAFDVKGNDPGAKLELLRDLNNSGTFQNTDPVLATLPISLTSSSGAATRATFTLDSLTVSGNGSSSLILAVELSGASPNLSSFTATLVPASTHTLGVRSQVTDQLSGSTAPVASSPAVTTLFGAADPPFLLSENPVRSGHVIFNFQSRPTVAAVFTLTGRRVVDLMTRLDGDGRVDWKLTNEQNDPVAPGIYLAVFQIGGQTIRQKLFVVSSAPAGASPQE